MTMFKSSVKCILFYCFTLATLFYFDRPSSFIVVDCGMGIPANRTSNIVGSIVSYFVDQSYVDPVMVLLIPENLGQLRSPQAAVKRSL